MKIAHLIAAATMFAGLGVSTAASAQDYRHDRYDRYEGRSDRRYDHRDDRRRYGNDRRRSYSGYRNRRCHAEYRHHRRVTVCYR